MESSAINVANKSWFSRQSTVAKVFIVIAAIIVGIIIACFIMMLVFLIIFGGVFGVATSKISSGIKNKFWGCATPLSLFRCTPNKCGGGDSKEGFSVQDVKAVFTDTLDKFRSVFGKNIGSNVDLVPEWLANKQDASVDQKTTQTLSKFRNFIINVLTNDESTDNGLFTDLNTGPLREVVNRYSNLIESHKMEISRLLAMSKNNSNKFIDSYVPFENILDSEYARSLDKNSKEYNLMMKLAGINCISVNMDCVKRNLDDTYADMSMDEIRGGLARVLKCIYRALSHNIPPNVQNLLQRYNSLHKPSPNSDLTDVDVSISDAINGADLDVDSTGEDYLESIVHKVIPQEQFERQANFNNEIYGFKGPTIKGIWEAQNSLVSQRGLFRQTKQTYQSHGYDGAPSSIIDAGRDQDMRPFLSVMVGNNAIAGTSD